MGRINLRQIDAFHKVILTGGITQAANMMNITQPAVSRLIKDFEYGLNLKLFERDGRGLVPRDEALKLFREIERLYLGIDHITRIADDIRQAKGSILRIGAVSSLSSLCAEYLFPPLLHDYPEISLFMDVESTLTITEMVMSNQYDVGFINGTPTVKGLHAEMIGTAHAVAVISPQHELADAPQITLMDLIRYRPILPGRKTILHDQILKAVVREGLELKHPVETALRHCCSMAAAGLGIGIVDLITAQTSSANLLIKPLLPRMDIAYLAIFPPQSARSQLIDTLIQRMKMLIATPVSGIDH
ncbi:LysR family transcriptional regulator [Musicola keenii]|uniref:LysR family transcriptional regulator n=1 Tax=Musicola keenii TaxID=2884250 RepID=UPI0017847F2F|nr:LysR family transcriptional regulator [Musicola keenii]